MAEPTLGEIASIQGNPNIGEAGTGVASNVLPDQSTALQYLSAAADARQKANDFLAAQHQANLKNTIDRFNDIDTNGVYAPDYDKITGAYKDLTSDLYDNYDIIQNPMKDPQRYAELMQKESQLRGMISQSKQDALLDKTYQDHLAAHPDFNTTDNTQSIQNFRTGQLGQRGVPTLASPTVYNPAAIVKGAVDYATTKTTTSTPGGGYIRDQSIEKSDPDQFMAFVNAYLSGSNGFGGTFGDALQKQYQALPDKLKTTETYDDFKKATFLPLMPKPSIINSTKPDSIAQEKMREKTEYGLNNLTFQHQVQLDKQKYLEQIGAIDEKGKLKANDPLLASAASAYNTQAASAFNQANDIQQPGISMFSQYQSKDIPVQYLPRVQIIPKIMTELGYQGEDKKTLKPAHINPDLVVRLPNGNFKTIFYAKGNDGTNITDQGGGVGQPLIEEEHSQEYSPDSYRQILFKADKGTGAIKAQERAVAMSNSLNDQAELQKYFGNKETASPKTPIKPTGSLSNDDYNNLLRQNGLIK